jgi:hypothetical protein
MGREVRRVPLDFDWPLKKVWKGYINPHSKECAWCRGRGDTKQAQRFDEFGRRLIIAADASLDRPEDYVPSPALRYPEDRDKFAQREPVWHRWSTNHTELPRWPFPDYDPVETLMTLSGLPADWLTPVEEHVIKMLASIEIPVAFYEPVMSRYSWEEVEGKRVRRTVLDPLGGTYYPHPYLCWEDGIPDVGPKFHELVVALAPKIKLGTIGDDGSAYRIQEAIMKHVGIPYEVEERSWGPWEVFQWGQCEQCGGGGLDPECRDAYEAWEDYEPPKGDAYQIWETTSEGSPITPPFETPEELARWCVDNKASTFGSETANYETWLKFIRGPGWAPSMIGQEGVGLVSGVEGLTRLEEIQKEASE